MTSRIDNLWQDVRYGSRSLRANLGFSAIAVLTLALGIGANSAIFSLVYAAILRPLPFPQVARLAYVSTGKAPGGPFNSGASGPELEEWKPQLGRIFEEFATISGTHDTTWTAASESAHLRQRDVSDNFFRLLGVHPFAGRAFTPEDCTAGHGGVVLISYALWQRQLAGDLAALGRPMQQKGGAYPSYTIIGILPPGFEFDEATDVWKPQQPLSSFVMGLRTTHFFRVIGRIARGISWGQAVAAMDTLAAQQALAHAESNRGRGINLVPLTTHFQAKGHLALLLLWVAVGCLLLIACANTANLLLARSGVRESEIAVRLALGASRGRLMAQLLTESSLLALLGGGSGWIAAVWTLRLLRFWGSFLLPPSTLEDILRMRADALDPAVAAFTVLASVAAVLTFGLAPARRSARLDLNRALQGASGNRNIRQQGISQALVTVEVAVVMVLVMSAGLLVRSFVKLTSVDLGFRAGNRLTFDIELPQLPASAAESSPMTPAATRQRGQQQTLWLEELERRLQSIMGVQVAGMSNGFPLTGEEGGWGVRIDGRQLPESTTMAHVSAGYFDALGAPVVEGSNFSARGSAGSKELIVNQTLARLLFPEGSAIGKHVNAPRCKIVSFAFLPSSDCVVIGVAQDIRFNLDSPPPPTFYYSLHDDAGDRVTYVARVAGDPGGLIPKVRTIVANMPPVNSGKAFLFHLQTVNELRAQSVAEPRFRSWLVSLFAGLALLLAAVGIYGVQGYAVSRRTREIGIRMALGAKPAAVFAMILGDATGWTLLGIAIGVGAGLALTRLISGLLFGVSRWDPVTLVLSPLVLLVVALAAAYLPARRAMRVDPMAALRFE
jgi:putative ABC transport system permease protein